MKTPLLSLALAAVAVASVSPVHARPGRDEDAVLDRRRAGQNMPLPAIERVIVPQMGGARYIGPEIIDEAHYRLKFMRGSKVIWVDVDARTAEIVGRAGD